MKMPSLWRQLKICAVAAVLLAGAVPASKKERGKGREREPAGSTSSSPYTGTLAKYNRA